MEPVNDSALVKELIVIRLLGSGVEVYKRGESWKIEARIEFDILGFHNNTKSQISFNKIMALHSMAVKEASSSAWLTSGSLKKRATVPMDCRGVPTWIYVGEGVGDEMLRR